jgi:uncharacterized oligopeptide transporter (OPT) family protein
VRCAGFIGVVPALALLRPDEGRVELTVSQNLLWALSITFFGLFVAVPLRKQTILVENLRFPSGTATAQLIEVLHCGTVRTNPKARARLRRQWRILGVAFSASAAYALLAYFVPGMYTGRTAPTAPPRGHTRPPIHSPSPCRGQCCGTCPCSRGSGCPC